MTILVAGGAGGDGKTTILELLSKYWALEGQRPVMAIDANPDQTLLSFFGIDPETENALPAICDHDDFLKQSLEGQNSFYTDLKHATDTSPVTEESRRWSLDDPDDEITRKLGLHHDGVTLMRAGTYNENDIGNGCLHSKISPLIFMLQRLYDGHHGEQGMVLVDNAHGRDAFGTALYAQGDAILVAARPEKKSLDILRDYVKTSKDVSERIGFPIEVVVIGSGLSNTPGERAEEEAAIRAVAGTSYAGGFETDPALKRKFSNTGPELHELSAKNYQTLASIAQKLEMVERIPERRKAWMEFCHFGATWKDTLIAPGVTGQRTSFVADACDHDHPHHVHGPNCRHGSGLNLK